jgi:hypothetical protein
MFINKKKIDNLLIVGDSYCVSRHPDSHYDWPVVLAKLLDCKLLGRGHSGISWWTSKLDLSTLECDPANTILIVVHTDSLRLPNDHKIPVNIGQVFVEKNESVTELDNWPGLREIASSFYTSDIFCPNFYHWAQQAWIKELDADTRYYATIHIPGFDSVDLSGVKNGIFIIPSKDHRSLRALDVLELEKDFIHMRDNRSNHFSNTNNVNLANALASIILKLQPGDTGERNFSNLHKWEFYHKKF